MLDQTEGSNIVTRTIGRAGEATRRAGAAAGTWATDNVVRHVTLDNAVSAAAAAGTVVGRIGGAFVNGVWKGLRGK